ncbi:MAG: hypothetical protein LC772_11640 [Chloroflexi bacterium]|nr:hypothetical protein [Chloroflexota bacterium]
MSRRKQSEITRREFLSGTVAGIAAAGLPAWFTRSAIAAELERDASAPRRIGPNDTIVIGVIGPGGSRGGYRQGLNDTRAAAAHHGTHIAAVCDLDELHRNEAAASTVRSR